MGKISDQRSSDQRDKQEDVPATQDEVAQPSSVNQVADDQRMPSSSCAEREQRTSLPPAIVGKEKGRHNIYVEPEMESTHADSDMSETEENETDTDSVNLSQETDSFVELVFIGRC